MIFYRTADDLINFLPAVAMEMLKYSSYNLVSLIFGFQLCRYFRQVIFPKKPLMGDIDVEEVKPGDYVAVKVLLNILCSNVVLSRNNQCCLSSCLDS